MAETLQSGPEEKFKCEICDKTFRIASNRNRHMRRLHQGQQAVVKAVSCDLCEYQCRDRYQLKVHLRSHTKDKPFLCSKCDHTASRREDLRRHEAVCRGPRHTCPICGKTFRARSGLNGHSVWDPGCGSLGQCGGGHGVEAPPVKLDLGQVTVVGVGCEQLLNDNIFTQGKRKRRCGLCYSCTTAPDCGTCSVCRGQDRRKTRCLTRSCYEPLEVYTLRNGDTEIGRETGRETEGRMDQREAQMEEEGLLVNMEARQHETRGPEIGVDGDLGGVPVDCVQGEALVECNDVGEGDIVVSMLIPVVGEEVLVKEDGNDLIGGVMDIGDKMGKGELDLFTLEVMDVMVEETNRDTDGLGYQVSTEEEKCILMHENVIQPCSSQ